MATFSQSLLVFFPAVLALSGSAASVTRRSPPPVCAVYGRSLGGHKPAQDLADADDAAQQLKAATLALSTHDKLALKTPSDPMGAIEEYYDEYLSALRGAVQVLSRHSSSIMLGVMGDHPEQAVDALRQWQQQLGLPQPQICMLDGAGDCLSAPMCDTTAKRSAIAGPAFLKFNSGTERNMLKPHDGPFRGVIITANLHEGTVRQFGGLPLVLFHS